MTLRQLTTLCLATPLLLALQPRADNVSFAPEDGSSLSKEFQVQFDLVLGDLTLLLNGMDMSESMPADFELSSELNMTVADEYVEVSDGVPLELIRTYEALEMVWETPDDSGEAEGIDEMVGKSVRFKWDEDAEEYVVSFHESEGDEDELESLGIDMDMRAVLPEDEVSEGDTWSLDPKEVAAMILFGTSMDQDMSFEFEDDEMGIGPLLEAELKPQIEALMDELTAECTYKGRRESEGVTVGAIDIQVEAEGELDLSGLIAGMIEAQVPPEVEISVDIQEAIVSLALEGEGTLLWNLEAGHMHAFEMSPEIEILVDVVMSAEAMGESQDIEARIELLGDGTWTARVAE